MQILITGGAGFIGYHLANRLNELGHYVRVLDDQSVGHPERLVAGINFNRGDVRDVPRLWALLQGVDVVYHLAARVSVPASVLYPREYNDVNVGGTVALLEACRDVGVQRLVLASSGAVYGDQSSENVSEKMVPRPQAPYAVSKVAAEQYMFNMGTIEDFETVALRIFNVYGPGQQLPPSHAPVIPQFMNQILGKGSVIVFGDGNQIRDFVHIDDVVAALVSSLDAPNIDQRIINVGSGKGTSINEIIRTLELVTGNKASTLYNTESSSGLSRLVADVESAGRLLNYEPRVSLADGLKYLMEQDPLFERFTRQIAA